MDLVFFSILENYSGCGVNLSLTNKFDYIKYYIYAMPNLGRTVVIWCVFSELYRLQY